MTLASLPAAARIDIAADNITVRIRYQGQRIPGDSYFYFISQAGGVNCGGDRFNVPVGGVRCRKDTGTHVPRSRSQSLPDRRRLSMWKQAGTVRSC
jgi:hypothetical protein